MLSKVQLPIFFLQVFVFFSQLDDFFSQLDDFFSQVAVFFLQVAVFFPQVVVFFPQVPTFFLEWRSDYCDCLNQSAAADSQNYRISRIHFCLLLYKLPMYRNIFILIIHIINTTIKITNINLQL